MCVSHTHYHHLQLFANNEKIAPLGNNIVYSASFKAQKQNPKRQRTYEVNIEVFMGLSYCEVHIVLIKNNCTVLELESLHGFRSQGHCCFS